MDKNDHGSTPLPSTSPENHLPLKPVDLQLLLALAGEERHGYRLVRAIEEATDGLVRLDPGSLHRVIPRLLAAGLVAESERRDAPDPGDERRRYHRLTALGDRVLSAELAPGRTPCGRRGSDGGAARGVRTAGAHVSLGSTR